MLVSDGILLACGNEPGTQRWNIHRVLSQIINLNSLLCILICVCATLLHCERKNILRKCFVLSKMETKELLNICIQNIYKNTILSMLLV